MQLFGDLPPSNLYLTHRDDHEWPHDSRRDSGSSVLTRATSTRTIDSYRNSIASLQHLVEADPTTLEAIVEGYAGERRRLSVASLRKEEEGESVSDGGEETVSSSAERTPKLAQSEDAAVEESTPALTSSSVFTNSTVVSDVSPSTPSAPFPPRAPLSRSNSASRTSRRAQKLSQFFGTTKGVWGLLLDDLETAIQEEEGLDDEERQEVLGGVSRLREVSSVQG